jgi:hypothetical protein
MPGNAASPRILMVSQRNIAPSEVWRSPHYEFEDLVRQFDAVELAAPKPKRRFRSANKRSRELARRCPRGLYPGIPKTRVTGRYDMLFVFCSYPWDLVALNLSRDWKGHFGTSVCMIDEIWVKQISQEKAYLDLLSEFDHVVLYYSQSVKAVGEATGVKTHFVPPGVDAIKFCPYPRPPARTVDVFSIGRRSPATHGKLLELARTRGLYYVYDTFSGNRVYSAAEHRRLLAETAKRSRYYIVNPGLVDCPEKRGDQIEIGNRYFEGAAAGCLMLGEVPGNAAYPDLFGWPDAVLHLPFGSDRIEPILDEMEGQPEREAKVRKNNIVHSLLKHDWVYRWGSVLEIAGLDPTPGMAKRKERLEELAGLAEGPAARLP